MGPCSGMHLLSHCHAHQLLKGQIIKCSRLTHHMLTTKSAASELHYCCASPEDERLLKHKGVCKVEDLLDCPFLMCSMQHVCTFEIAADVES